MRTRHLIVGALFIALVLFAVILARRAGEEGPAAAKPGSRAQPASSGTAPAGHTARGEPSEQAGPSEARAGEPRKASEARARLARDIERARERRVARESAGGGASGAETPPPELQAGTLDKEYIQDRVREIIPLVKECYEMALEESPELEGTLVVSFALAGEPEIGGVVESSEIDTERSTVAHPQLSECLSESMYALEFEPPANGGRVEVKYPFKFRSADPE